METKKHLFGTTEKSDFILNMTKEQTYKLMGMFCIIAMWVLAVCALPYYLTKNAVKGIEESNGFSVTHYYTENTVAIMSTAVIAVGFLSVLMFLIARMKNEATLKGKTGLVTLVLLVIMSLISMFSSASLRKAFFGHSTRSDGFLEFMAYIGFIAMGLLITNDTWRKRFCDNLVAIGAFEAVFGIAQCISPKVPNFFNELFVDLAAGITDETVNDMGYIMMPQSCATGLMCSPHGLAAALTVLFAFAAAGVMYSKSIKRKSLYLCACVLMAIASVLTHVLAGLVGIPVVLAVLLVIEVIRLARKNVLWNKKALENALVCCIITIAVTAAAFIGLKIGGGLKLYDERVIFTDTFTRLSSSYQNRLNTELDIYADYRKVGASAVRYELDEKKYFGMGQDNLDSFFGAVQGFRTDRLYNDYLDFILQRGIPAFVTYCIFLIYALFNGIKSVAAFYKKQQPFYGAAALAGLVGYLVIMFWNTSGNSYTYFAYLCIGMMIMYGQKKALSPKEKKQAARDKKAKKA